MHAALASLGWDDALAAAFAPFHDTHIAGRVSHADRGLVDVLVARDESQLDSMRVRCRPSEAAPAVGDWVAVADDDAGPYADVVLPRRSAITRALASGRSDAQVLAANVDVVFITVPVFPEPKAGMVERLIALSWESGACPVIVLTKTDLTSESEAIAADLADAAPGVEVLAVSAFGAGGVAPLHDHLAFGRTVCLLGRSGAGKSTLANTLLGADVLDIGDIRRDGKGRHTTTTRDLVLLPDGGVLLDTPGLRGAGLWVGEEALDRTFADVEALTPGCRFSDCGHDSEPGCAVLAAIEDGTLSERRLASWRKLQREARWMASRTDARLRAEQRRTWKIIHKEVRRSGRIRD